MISRQLLPATALALFATAGPAGAQFVLDEPEEAYPAAPATARGALTVTSSPPGAVVSLDGNGIHLVGRTPWTISRGLEGLFTLRSHLTTHEAWERSIYVDPTAVETMHMDIRAKTAARAALRSLFVPGWGQTYGARNGPAAAFFLSSVASGTYLGLTHARYDKRRDDVVRAWQAYAESEEQPARERLWEEVQATRRRAQTAADERSRAFILLASVWGLNLLDSIFFFPDMPLPIVTTAGQTGLHAAPRPDGAELGVVFGY